MNEEDKVPQYNLYHGMRSKKTPEQIMKEGFCVTYMTIVDAKKEIKNALRHFGKEDLLTRTGTTGELIRQEIRMIGGKNRRNVWATTDEEAPCEWWAHSNPEHISMVLHYAGIESSKIDKYLKETYGENCYNIKLKMTSRGTNPNFNTGLNCIPPQLIDIIEECEECKYTGKEHKKLKPTSTKST